MKVEFREEISLSVAVSLNLPFSLSDVCFLEEVEEVEVQLGGCGNGAGALSSVGQSCVVIG